MRIYEFVSEYLRFPAENIPFSPFRASLLGLGVALLLQQLDDFLLELALYEYLG